MKQFFTSYNVSIEDDGIDIILNGLSHGYTPHKPVIENINLNIYRGGFYGLLGPSGAGKSTLLKIIIGLIKPWSGRLYLNKNRANSLNSIKTPHDLTPFFCNYSLKSFFGYVPQIESVDWTFPVTVREVIGMGVWNKSGISPWMSRKTNSEIDSILDSLGIPSKKFAKRQIRELSGGEQQRVFLARALICKPRVLVLDEPTTGVDNNTRERILKTLQLLHSIGVTIILTTHDLIGIAKRLPQVVCINKTIIAQGTPEKTLTESNLLKTYGLAEDVDQ